MNHQVVRKKSDSHYYFFIRGLIRSQFHWHQFPTRFNQATQRLDSNSRSVFLDIPGNGHRFKQATPFSIKEMAVDINTQIQQFLVANPTDSSSKLHIVGISMGGMIAAELAVNTNIKFASIHIINSSFANLSPFWQRMRLPAVMNLLPNLWQAEKRESSILKWTSNKPLPADLAPKWVEEAHRHPLTLRNAFAQLWAASHHFVGNKPGMDSFVYCCQADRLVSWKCSDKLAKHWQVSLDCEPEAGHDLPLDNPDWLAERIIQHSQQTIK